MFQQCFNNVSTMFQQCFNNVSTMFQECFNNVSTHSTFCSTVFNFHVCLEKLLVIFSIKMYNYRKSMMQLIHIFAHYSLWTDGLLNQVDRIIIHKIQSMMQVNLHVTCFIRYKDMKLPQQNYKK